MSKGRLTPTGVYIHVYFGPWLQDYVITDKQTMIYNIVQPKDDKESQELDELVKTSGVENGMLVDDPKVLELQRLTSTWKENRNHDT